MASRTASVSTSSFIGALFGPPGAESEPAAQEPRARSAAKLSPCRSASLRGPSSGSSGRTSWSGSPPARGRPAAQPARAAPLFEPDAAAVRARLAETSEARALLDGGELAPTRRRARPRRGAAAPREGRRARRGESCSTSRRPLEPLRGDRALSRGARGARAAARGARRRDRRPGRPRDAAILAALEPDGTVRDALRPSSRAARRDARELAAESAGAASSARCATRTWPARLSDSYFTVRNDRYVLPVRAESRARVPRHRARRVAPRARTLFVEPEALVELNNRHKQAELDDACARRSACCAGSRTASPTARARPRRRASTPSTRIDLAFARGRALAGAATRCEPEVGDAGVVAAAAAPPPAPRRRRRCRTTSRSARARHVLVHLGAERGRKDGRAEGARARAR